MKPETQAELWGAICAWADADETVDTVPLADAINAILSRHVEQPVETEAQAAERLAEALWALDAAETGYRWSERNDDTKRFWLERAGIVREALRLAKETEGG